MARPGLPIPLLMAYQAAPVRAILDGGDGSYWFATNHGVTRYDGTSWQTYSVADGLAHNDVRDIAKGTGKRISGRYQGDVSFLDRTLSPQIRIAKLATSSGEFLTTSSTSSCQIMRTISASSSAVVIQTVGQRTFDTYISWDSPHNVAIFLSPLESTASYFNLPEGTYAFQVKSRDLRFNYSEPVTLTFAVWRDCPSQPRHL